MHLLLGSLLHQLIRPYLKEQFQEDLPPYNTAQILLARVAVKTEVL
jgi:hypothetical protein